MRAPWLRWSAAGKQLDDEWKDGHYDPRTRPWFEAAQKATSDDLAWTAPYRLLTTGDGGITVSTRWRGADGKTRVLAWYLSTAAVVSAYGAAGSLVVVLMWFYFTSAILLFAAATAKACSKADVRITRLFAGGAETTAPKPHDLRRLPEHSGENI